MATWCLEHLESFNRLLTAPPPPPPPYCASPYCSLDQTHYLAEQLSAVRFTAAHVVVHLCSNHALHVMLLSRQGQELD